MLAVAALVATASLTGCVRVEGCPGWVDFETPQDMYDGAQVVLLGRPTSDAGDRDVFGRPAAVHRVLVADVLKGELEADLVEVASTPVTCSGENDAYPDGDPLDVEGEVILFLTDSEGGWRLMTPFDGVLPIPDDGVLPFEVEDR